jgi:hypothetical protein
MRSASAKQQQLVLTHCTVSPQAAPPQKHSKWLLPPSNPAGSLGKLRIASLAAGMAPSKGDNMRPSARDALAIAKLQRRAPYYVLLDFR